MTAEIHFEYAHRRVFNQSPVSFLAVTERFFHTLAIRDVDDHLEDSGDFVLLVEMRRQYAVDVAAPAVQCRNEPLETHGLAAQRSFHVAADRLEGAIAQHVPEVAAIEVVASGAKPLFEGTIGQPEAAVAVHIGHHGG